MLTLLTICNEYMMAISWCGSLKEALDRARPHLVLKGDGLLDAGSDHGSAAKGSAIIQIWKFLALVRLAAVFHSLLLLYHV